MYSTAIVTAYRDLIFDEVIKKLKEIEVGFMRPHLFKYNGVSSIGLYTSFTYSERTNHLGASLCAVTALDYDATIYHFMADARTALRLRQGWGLGSHPIINKNLNVLQPDDPDGVKKSATWLVKQLILT